MKSVPVVFMNVVNAVEGVAFPLVFISVPFRNASAIDSGVDVVADSA